MLLGGFLLAASLCFGAAEVHAPLPNIFRTESTPADSIFHLSIMVLVITGLIFVVVFGLLVYSVAKYRRRGNEGDDGREPPQVYGSNQVELAWTVIPVLIVLVLFLATARVIQSVQDAPKPPGAIEVVAVGHQFWWEYRYPALGVVTANELHVPVSDPLRPSPTFLTLLSADTDHSFWVPNLAGKTDLIPNRTNHMWIDPYRTGLYVGQCAQYCGTQHAKMLLRVYVDSRGTVRPMGAATKKAGGRQRFSGRLSGPGPANFSIDGLRKLPRRFRNGGGRGVRSRSHSFDEPGHHRRGRRDKYPRESPRLASEPRLNQAGFPDAGHAVERQGSGRGNRLSRDPPMTVKTPMTSMTPMTPMTLTRAKA